MRQRHNSLVETQTAEASKQANAAPGAPGLAPNWSRGAKDLVVAAPGARVTAALGQAIVHEIFWPSVGRPQVRDLGFLIVGPTWWHEVKTNDNYTVEVSDPRVPLAVVRAEIPGGTFETVTLVDPDGDALAVEYRLNHPESCQVIALCSPHVSGTGWHDTAEATANALYAYDSKDALAVLSSSGFDQTSVGYVGESDGWQDVNQHGRLLWNFTEAPLGNVAVSGSLTATHGTITVGFGHTIKEAHEAAQATLDRGFAHLTKRFVAVWKPFVSKREPLTANPVTGLRSLRESSETVIRAHMDQTERGAIVASVATPWGDHVDSSGENRGGYHLVWGRDCVESAFGLIASGHVDDAAIVLQYLARRQRDDGSWPQNWFPDGEPYWTGLQLDETALPVLLAAKLGELNHEVANTTEIQNMVRKAVQFLVNSGPVSPQDRWEENSGISPFTLAATIAAIQSSALLGFLGHNDANYALSVGRDWDRRIEEWVYVTDSMLDALHGTAGHYVRIRPATDTRTGSVVIRNRVDVSRSVAETIGLEFLAFVRFGLREPHDPRVTDSVILCDRELRIEVDGKPYYYRYEDDGYGEHSDGSPFDGTGIGRTWPLLTAERGVYAAQAAEDTIPYLTALVACTTKGGMLPEQVWDGQSPDTGTLTGKPTGSAAPLVWAHAELLKLAAAHQSGRPVELLDCIDQHRMGRRLSGAIHWRSDLPVDQIPTGARLIIEDNRPFMLHVGVNGWQEVEDIESEELGLGRHGVALEANAAFSSFEFTRWWKRDDTIDVGTDSEDPGTGPGVTDATDTGNTGESVEWEHVDYNVQLVGRRLSPKSPTR